MNLKRPPFLLAILDGLALNPNSKANAVALANTSTLDELFQKYPWTTLISYGERVGLPEGQMGNSEVGHLNIGAGRVVEQDLTRINKISDSKSFDTIPAFAKLAEKLTVSNGALHLIGLTSPGGVHSQLSQLISILHSCCSMGISKVFLHIITDGRDRPRDSALNDLVPLLDTVVELSSKYASTEIKIASIIGRYFAMDRDNRWDRTKKAYDLYVSGVGGKSENINSILKSSYDLQIFDEFIEPMCITSNNDGLIKDGDAIFFYNYRADRMRQIVSSFIDESFSGFQRPNAPILCSVISMCEYDAEFKIDCMFPTIVIKNHLGEVISSNNLSQLRIAETEKYPHVTYFFNGGSEVILKGEIRIMVSSPRDVATYDKKPEMSAYELTDKLIELLDKNPVNAIILNFANCDMVGHTGNLDAAIKAVETVDKCLGIILTKLKNLGGSALITADHGNSDQMIDYQTQEPHTYHTMHPVPLIYFGPEPEKHKLESGGALCDIAPTALKILNLPIPKEMTGKSLLVDC